MSLNGVNVDNYSVNVPLFNGTVFISMRKFNNNRRRYNNRRRGRQNWNNYERRISQYRNNAFRHSNNFPMKSEAESSQEDFFQSQQVLNPFSLGRFSDAPSHSKLSISELKTIEPVVLVHGGAGNIPDSNVKPKIDGVKLSATIGYKTLLKTGSVLDAVEAAVVSMEKDPAFNAGYGSVLNLDGEVEMEASIQRGSDLAAGCVTLIKDFSHPISIARKVMEQTPHSMLGGDGARRFAIKQGFTPVDPMSLITPNAVEALEKVLDVGGDGGSELAQSKSDGVGTVGAVAIDTYGRIAVATSTGGRTGKYVGRIGDTPQIGSGTYADDTLGGVSTTGHGESILRTCLAHTIIKNIENGFSAQDATVSALNDMTKKMKNTAGAITISHQCEVGIYFTSERMAWSFIKGNRLHYGIEKNEHREEKFTMEDEDKKEISLEL